MPQMEGWIRFVYYTCIILWITPWLIQQPWMYEISIYMNHPYAQSEQVIKYYTLAFGFYVYQLAAVLLEKRKKDFWVMLLHHLCTMVLLVMSWHQQETRLGSLIMWLHDLADPFLEGSKLLHKNGMRTASEITFVVFATVFWISRLCLYPVWILKTVIREDKTMQFVIPLVLLQVMHVYWFIIIVRMSIRFWRVGTIDKDDRSDSDSS
jgi:hypothetical protein